MLVTGESIQKWHDVRSQPLSDALAGGEFFHLPGPFKFVSGFLGYVHYEGYVLPSCLWYVAYLAPFIDFRLFGSAVSYVGAENMSSFLEELHFWQSNQGNNS